MDFMAFIENLKSPTQQITEAIEKDDLDSLKKLFLQNHEILENNYQLFPHQNILHFSITCRAYKCIEYLIENENFEIHYSFITNWDAAQYAFVECDIEVLYSILKRYPTLEKLESTKGSIWSKKRQVLPVNAPHFPLMDYLLYPTKETYDKFSQTLNIHLEKILTPSPLCLAYELDQSALKEMTTTTTSWTPYTLGTINPGEDKQVDTWWSSTENQPLYLSEIARRCIRHVLSETLGKPDVKYSEENYFFRVEQLPLPPRLKCFVCYGELWPRMKKGEKIGYIRRGIKEWNSDDFYYMRSQPRQPPPTLGEQIEEDYLGDLHN